MKSSNYVCFARALFVVVVVVVVVFCTFSQLSDPSLA